MHFCVGFLNGKMTTWLNGETEDFIFFSDGPLDVLEVCDNERGVLRKECRLEMCTQTHSYNKDNKEWW